MNKMPEVYCEVRLTPEAEDMCVGGTKNARIVMIRRGFEVRSDFFTWERINQILKKDIPIIWKIKGDFEPTICEELPESVKVFGDLNE